MQAVNDTVVAWNIAEALNWVNKHAAAVWLSGILSQSCCVVPLLSASLQKVSSWRNWRSQICQIAVHTVYTARTCHAGIVAMTMVIARELKSIGVVPAGGI